MGKKKNRETVFNHKIRGRAPNLRDRSMFCHQPRDERCLRLRGSDFNRVDKLDKEEIKNLLGYRCRTIEHQFLALRDCTQLTEEDFQQRYIFTQMFLDCLYRHHDLYYEGILFGSTINGLGFRDSDVDLRLRPLKRFGRYTYEPFAMDEEWIERTLRNIAYQTTRCYPAIGEFVPSSRCPVAKLTFITPARQWPDRGAFQEGLKYDVSLSSSNPLGTFNSMFLRFLCRLQPKFHLLATVLRYWSNVHKLIVPGYLSSYALINMLIFFCQTVEPPLLPTVDFMRDLFFKSQAGQSNGKDSKKGLTQVEWHCVICFQEELYPRSENIEPLCVLLLKFFEMYLKFPYSTNIITTRPGKSLNHEEFKNSTQYHPKFPINTFLSIQDPFDLKHNLTAGMQGFHFQLIMSTMRNSYEKLYAELMNNFCIPQRNPGDTGQLSRKSSKKSNQKDFRDWGLNALFVRLNERELNDE